MRRSCHTHKVWCWYSSSRFPVKSEDPHTDKVEDATDYLTHASTSAGVSQDDEWTIPDNIYGVPNLPILFHHGRCYFYLCLPVSIPVRAAWPRHSPVSVLVRVGRVERLEFVEERVDNVDEEHEVHLHNTTTTVIVLSQLSSLLVTKMTSHDHLRRGTTGVARLRKLLWLPGNTYTCRWQQVQ